MNTDLARELLIRHSRSEKNGVFPSAANLEGKLTNPLCGDHVELRVQSEGRTIIDIGHRATACAICSASASLLCETLKGTTIEQALNLSQVFEKAITESAGTSWPEVIDSLECFKHLRVNPSRRMCAALPWLVLKAAVSSGPSLPN
jgi:nitrogen fixation NifU-like protein